MLDGFSLEGADLGLQIARDVTGAIGGSQARPPDIRDFCREPGQRLPFGPVEPGEERLQRKSKMTEWHSRT
jgi:hypothetical protein